MDCFGCYLLRVLLLALLMACSSKAYEPNFDQNYQVTWGADHFAQFFNGRRVQLSLDKASGSGFESKLEYFTGIFKMRIKLPAKSRGVVTTFYLRSDAQHQHDELDFEFLGDEILQTNIFVNGVGNREQRLRFWFDPTKNFHDYKILWNPYIIVFYVDDIPIRVFKNQQNEGLVYPTQPMEIEGTIWNAENWAGPIDWSKAPFKAQYEGFGIQGCPSGAGSQRCAAAQYPWNHYRRLSVKQQRNYERVKKQFMIYDYCSDRNRKPEYPRECL